MYIGRKRIHQKCFLRNGGIEKERKRAMSG